MDISDKLQGRIIALELIMQGFMVQQASEQQTTDTPLEFLIRWEKQMRASLQHLHRPLNNESDEIWGEATTALKLLFSNASARVREQQSRSFRP